ncbi:ankyrin repeat-containing domain protein [Coprinopsis sp. MPI-PUGE-AT-0042]|nr:ankyrin repeat-containing domain protein [Coprinopsis sp. MPI-PUGE-AT-0042]
MSPTSLGGDGLLWAVVGSLSWFTAPLREDESDHELRLDHEQDIFQLLSRCLTKAALARLDAGADPSSIDSEGRSLLSVAISWGNTEVVEKLLQSGADISTGNASQFHDTIAKWYPSTTPPLCVYFVGFISISALILDFFRPYTLPDSCLFSLQMVSATEYAWALVEHGRLDRFRAYYLVYVAIAYQTLRATSTYTFDPLASFAQGTLQGRTIAFYVIRATFSYSLYRLNSALFISRNVRNIRSSPGAKALESLVQYKAAKGEDMLRMLLDRGIDLGRADGHEANIFTGVWMWAIFQGYSEAAERLSPYSDTFPTLYCLLDPTQITQENQDTIPLILSARNHRSKMVALLLSKSELDPYPQKVLDLALLACAMDAFEDAQEWKLTMSHLLAANADANATDANGRSVLSWVCRFSQSDEAVQLLLSKGANSTINSMDEDGLTALHHASKNSGHSAASVEHLLNAGASVNILDGRGRTPLWWSAFNGSMYPPIVQALLNGGEATTPLIEACLHSSLEIVQILLNHGANVNARAENSTPLLAAISRGPFEKTDVISLLLKRGAKLILDASLPMPLVEVVGASIEEDTDYVSQLFEVVGERGLEVDAGILESAYIRVMGGHPLRLDLARFLLQQDVDPNIRHLLLKNRTTLHLIHQREMNSIEYKDEDTIGNESYIEALPITVALLLEKGAEMEALDDDSHTPLHLAILAAKAYTVKVLLQQGANAHKADRDGRACLHLACHKEPLKWTGHTPLGHHPDLDKDVNLSGPRMSKGEKAFHIQDRTRLSFQSLDEEKIIKKLLKCGANPLAMDRKGQTPLHLACSIGNPITAGILLRMALDNPHFVGTSRRSMLSFSAKDLLVAEDNQGRLPLHLAVQSGNEELVLTVLAPEYGTNSMTGNRQRWLQREDIPKDEWHQYVLSTALISPDKKGRTPVDYAIESKQPQILFLLLEMVQRMSG